jgi:uncharacterized protein (DUF983 family)
VAEALCPSCGAEVRVYREGGRCGACGESFSLCDQCDTPAVEFQVRTTAHSITLVSRCAAHSVGVRS